MSPRPRQPSTIADIIAAAVKAQLGGAAEEGGGRRRARRVSTQPTSRGGRPASGRSSQAGVAPPTTNGAEAAPADAAGAPLAPAEPGSSGTGAEARPNDGAMSLAARRAAERELIERVREDLKAAYEGQPVSPDRIAFRLKVDRVLVDAALTLLVNRKEARAKWIKGRVAYTPAFPH